MIPTFLDGLDEIYHHAKFGEDRTTCAGCRCENVIFLFFVFFCHAPRPARCSFEGCIVQTSIALPFIGQFRHGFQPFSEVPYLSQINKEFNVRVCVCRMLICLHIT